MFRTIVWATDGSDAADRALPFAKALADGEGRTLLVVHIEELLVGRAGGYPVLAAEGELQAKIRRQVDGLREEGYRASLKLVTGLSSHPAHMIAEAAREAGADVIVVGTRGHAPVAGLLLGSVTQRLLHIAPCPVLAVPAGKAAVEQNEDADVAVAAR
ncbi:MAG TPA: universal stress protein [Gaiellaceae bacterium]|nr:universal stress protein [Gaiellaceae bacterium]